MGDPLAEHAFYLDAAERELIDAAITAVEKPNPKQHEVLSAALTRLRKTAELIRDSPSIGTSWGGGGGRAFSADTLIAQLCRVPDYDLDLHIPTKAVIGQTFLIAKINFLKAVGYTLESVSAPAPLRERTAREVAQSIYTKLAEELFVSIVTDPEVGSSVKQGAARFLFRIWEERLLIEVDDFAPLLESAWAARSKLRPVLGTMLGTHEVFRLFHEARDKRFLDYFGEDHVDDEQLLAFEEFLFGIAHEEINRLREHMTTEGISCLSLEAALALLGGEDRMPHEGGASALYTSYKKRRVNAAHRALTGASGPKKTAEEYVMIAFLSSGGTPSIMQMKAVQPSQ
jgi:hypothetical protein